jgi:Caspase domain
MPVQPTSGTRRALLIGIDRYENLPSDKQLTGCVNDAEALAGLLTERFRFAAGNVERLLDRDATRAGIRAAVERLIERTTAGDVVVIHYSGHGSQSVDPASPYGTIETIMPCDSGRDGHPNLDIADLEIHHWLLRLCDRSSHLTLIFDSCHSGRILRDGFGAPERWVAPHSQPVDLPPEVVAAQGVPGGSRDGSGGGAGGLRLPLAQRYVLLAACASEESAFEVVGQDAGARHGAFSYFLCQELAKASALTTFRDVFEVVAPRVSSLYPNQHPQLEGACDQQVFGLESFPPMQFVTARPASGEVLLEAGAACGMTVGSRWRIYPPGTRSLSCGSQPVAVAEVTRVGAVRSHARLVSGQLAAEGGRAVEDTHRYGAMRYLVEVAPPTPVAAAPAGVWPAATRLRHGGSGTLSPGERVAHLRQAVAASRILGVAECGAGAAARAYLLPARAGATGGDPVPTASPLTEDTWAVVGRDGELLMRLRPATASEAVAQIVVNLEQRARYQFAMELVDPGGPLCGTVQLALLGRDGDRWVRRGDEQGSARGDAAAYPAFKDGERIAFEISHRYASPLYLYLLDFGISGAINLIYPMEGGEQIPAGRDNPVRVGVDEEQAITMFIPDGLPFAAGAGAPPQGWPETFKLFATTRQADFSSLLQTGMVGAGAREPAGALAALLAMSLSGQGTRDATVGAPLDDGDWTVVQRSLRLLPAESRRRRHSTARAAVG